MKDHEIRELVNQIRDIAIEYHGTQQLRERIAHVIRAAVLQAGNCREYSNSSTNNCREIAETSTNRSREHFISLCNEFWNWSEMDLVCADDRGYDLRMEWDGKVFNHPVTQALWRMYQAAPTGIPIISDRWIPVSERMPEMGEQQCYVLAADFKNHYWPNIPNIQVGVYGDWFDDGNPTWDDGDGEDLHLKEVTHWMVLPNPPQEAQDDINALIPLVSRNEREVK